MNAVTNINIVNVLIEMRATLQKIITSRTGGNTQTAQDIYQDIYFRVSGMSSRFETDNDARNYLIRVALNAAIDWTRSERRHAQILDGATCLFENYCPQPEDDLQLKQRLSVLDSALDELPAKCRDILYLSRIEGMTHTQIAEKLGVSRSLVEKYAVRALLHCRDEISKSEGNPALPAKIRNRS